MLHLMSIGFFMWQLGFLLLAAVAVLVYGSCLSVVALTKAHSSPKQDLIL